MEYGFCTGFASVPLWQIEEDMILDIKASGYDYPEFPVMSFAEMSEEEFSRLEKMASAPVACNLFPSYIPLSNNNRDLNKVREYLDIAFTRASRLSIGKIIFGSGKARSFSSPTTREEGKKNLYETIENAIIPKAKEYGIKVLVEPLTRGECNIINTLLDGYEAVKYFNDENFLLMADLFHMKNNGENLETLSRSVFPPSAISILQERTENWKPQQKTLILSKASIFLRLSATMERSPLKQRMETKRRFFSGLRP